MRKKLEELKLNQARCEKSEDFRQYLLGIKLQESADLKKLSEAEAKLEQLILRMQVASQVYKRGRTQILKKETNEYLSKLFTEDNFIISFEPVLRKGKEYFKLYSGHEDCGMSPTEMQHGRLMRQFLGVAVSTTIQKLSGVEVIVMDEALNSGDAETLEKIGVILTDLLENGLQIIMIEHQHSIYKNIPRIEYHLKRNKITNVSNITEVKDYLS